MLAELNQKISEIETNRPEDPSKAYSEVFIIFSNLISDESHYSQVMRKFLKFLKVGVLLDLSPESRVTKLIAAIQDKNLKSLVYASYGRNEPPTLAGTLCTVLELYRKDTDDLKVEIQKQKEETQSSLIIYQKKKR